MCIEGYCPNESWRMEGYVRAEALRRDPCPVILTSCSVLLVNEVHLDRHNVSCISHNNFSSYSILSNDTFTSSLDIL